MWVMIVMTCRSTESRMNQLTTCLPHLAQQLRSYMKVRSRLSAQCLTLRLASLVDFSRLMSTVAPKTKEEYVLAVASRSKVPRDELRKHTLDRLMAAEGQGLDPAAQLEEVGQDRPQDDLPESGGAGLGEGERPPLRSMVEACLLLEIEVWAEDAAKDFQLDRDLDMSEKGPLCRMRNTDHGTNQSAHPRGVLWVSQIPELQDNPSDVIRRKADGTSSTRAEQDLAREARGGGRREEDDVPRDQPVQAQGTHWKSGGVLGRILGGDRTTGGGGSLVGREPVTSLQHQSHE